MPTRILFIVATIIVARITSAIQFQSVAAVGPALVEGLALAYVSLGTLIGAYSVSGVVVAFPGSWLLTRLGERRMVLAAFSLLTLGAVMMALAAGYPMLLAGRIVAGAGNVLVTVVLPKIIIDLTPPRYLGAVMGTFIAGYGTGIGIALAGLPLLGPWRLAFAVSAVLCATAGIVAAAALPPKDPRPAALGASPFTLDRASWTPLLLISLVWALENVGVAVIFGFYPPFFIAQGLSLPQATSLTSLFAFAGVPATPFGAWLLTRTIGDRAGILLAVVLSAAAPVALALGYPPVPLLIASSLAICIAAGPQFALVGARLRAEERALAMGVFWTIYYTAMSALPPLAGLARDLTTDPRAPLYVASLFTFLALLLQAIHTRISGPAPHATG